MAVLYGYWGFTSIFLFWGALIRATRDWGGNDSQGMAFGILEGGRGLTAAIISSLGVVILAAQMPKNVELAGDEERRAAFRSVILLYSAITALSGVAAWVLIPVADNPAPARPGEPIYAPSRRSRPDSLPIASTQRGR